jgi:hypothetical protein
MSRTTVTLPALTIGGVGEGGGFHAGGSVTYRVFFGERWVGWVGDGREWRGWRYGGRRWWACWREDGDTAARWNSDLTHSTRRAALGDLLTKVVD